MERSLLFNRIAYNPPSWISSNVNPNMIPSSRIVLGRLPTPIHRFNYDNDITDSDIHCWIKRDDLTSFDLSGNKVRKLEFLLCEALDGDYDSIITIGGIQSNHARSTAVASRQLGLTPYLILRSKETPEEYDISGNLMLDRLVGAEIHQVTPSTYAQIGSVNLTHQLAVQLEEQGKKPYIIPVGGSNALGCFGYLDAVQEIIDQLAYPVTRSTILGDKNDFDHIVFACGSGGTAAGLSIGIKLAGLPTKVHAVCVCDSPEYFYKHIEETAIALGINLDIVGKPQEWLDIYPGQGLGYARSTDDELEYIKQVGSQTGIVFDPVYSGKALYNFKTIVKSNPNVFKKGDSVLFIHTGGVFGMYEKQNQLLPLLQPVVKMKVVKP